MIKIFYGDDRLSTEQEITRILGSSYERIDGEFLTINDLPSIFYGTSLFNENRKILIKNLFTETKQTRDLVRTEVIEATIRYVDTTHQIIIWEKTLDRRTSAVKNLIKAIGGDQNLKEFKLKDVFDSKIVFTIYDLALKNGPEAIQRLERVESKLDPFMTFGSFTWKAIDYFKKSPSAKTKRALIELSLIDMQLKSTKLSSQPWLLLKSFLLRLSSL